MSLSIGSTPAANPVAAVQSTQGATTNGGGVLPFGLGTTAAGAGMAQPDGGPSLIKRVLIGGVVGAGLGFGASFLPLPFVGGLTAPVMAAAGAAIGAIAGGVSYFLAKRSSNLAMEAQAQAQLAATQPTPVAPTGATLKIGSRGPGTRTLQTNLKKLGLFPHKVTGTFDKPTANAIRRYEVMKGVMPTGLGSMDVRTAIDQDVKLLAQYA